MARNYSSTAVDTTLSAAITASATSITVVATTGFPAAPFILAVDAGASTQELVLVTAVAGTTLTVTRGYDSTTAQAHASGAAVSHSHAGIDFREASKGTLGYAQVTASQAGITAAVDLTGLSVTVTVGTSRRIRVTGSVYLTSTVLDDGMASRILEGANMLQEGQAPARPVYASIERSVILTPTPGSHTYKMQALRASGAGSVTSGAGATYPAFILVEDIGAA